ncbi:heterokaryon incompatibility protein-domain-containing protein [Xylogone sp. PMI_703]|nr:heterokaryon incompatibility protein-domain-containing protein [Xylogone sp. PMI_703]
MGDIARRKTLFLGSRCRRLGITNNCGAALRCLRKEAEHIKLWIDAICINQCDPQEKGVQISLMDEIYSKAANVVIYLGSGNEKTDRALQLLGRNPRITESQITLLIDTF